MTAYVTYIARRQNHKTSLVGALSPYRAQETDARQGAASLIAPSCASKASKYNSRLNICIQRSNTKQPARSNAEL
jgi:hypothetical protein